MPTVTFDAVAEGRVITIPSEYVGKISGIVSVTAESHTSEPADAHIAAFEAHMEAIREERRLRPASLDDFNDFSFSTKGWKFDREEIHERG